MMPTADCPKTVLSGKAVNYRAVQYDLTNIHAEPHDVAVDPKGNPWVAERAGKLGHLDAKTLEFTEIDTPPGPAAADRQSLGNPQIDAKGVMWVPDGPNGRWLSYDTNSAKFVSYAWPKRQGQRRRKQHGHPSGRYDLGDRRRGRGPPAQPETRESSSSSRPRPPRPTRIPAPTAWRSPATDRYGLPKTRPT